MLFSIVDLDSSARSCYQPYNYGRYERTGDTDRVFTSEQMILIDAARRVAEQTEIDFEIIDVGKWSLVRRIMSNKSRTTPRIEFNGEILTGIPTSDEIIEFIVRVILKDEETPTNILRRDLNLQRL